MQSVPQRISVFLGQHRSHAVTKYNSRAVVCLGHLVFQESQISECFLPTLPTHITRLDECREAAPVTPEIWGDNIKVCVIKRLGKLAIASAMFSHAVGDQDVCASFGGFTAEPLAAKYAMAVAWHVVFLSKIIQSALSYCWRRGKYSLPVRKKTHRLRNRQKSFESLKGSGGPPCNCMRVL